MKLTGYALIGLGFLVGALTAVQSPADQVAWAWYLPALLAGGTGVVLARVAAHRHVRHAGRVTLRVQQLLDSMERIVASAQRLDREKESLHPMDVHGRIDQLFPADLELFVEARASLGHRHGLAAYATVMNEFAAGERYLNRAWSASVDGYIDEVNEFLGRARRQFEQTWTLLRALEPATTWHQHD